MATAVKKALEISATRAAELLHKPVIAAIRWAIYLFCLKGLTPLLMDRMTRAQIKGLKDTSFRPSYPNNENFTVTARRKLYSDAYDGDANGPDEIPTGAITIPLGNLVAALRDAGEKIQFGSNAKSDRITLSTKGTELFNMIQFQESGYPVLDFDGKPYTVERLVKLGEDEWIDLRKGNANQGKGAVAIVRPILHEWGIVGHVNVNIDAIHPSVVLRLFQLMGIRQGLCSARPSRKMPFGQCGLTCFEWVGGADPKTATVSPVRIAADGNGKPTRRKKSASGSDITSVEGNGSVDEMIADTSTKKRRGSHRAK